MTLVIPKSLRESCRKKPERREWLAQLPLVINKLTERWSLSLGAPFDGDEVSCSWVTLATRENGSTAIFKVGMPHMEGLQEIEGLRFWSGDGTVRLLEADDNYNAMLIERCVPGTFLRELAEADQDLVIAKLLRRLWRRPAKPHAFRSLSEMIAYWSSETLEARARWTDVGLVSEGLRLFAELSPASEDGVLLATDLHAGNVLKAQREPWLVIDPKPFVGDPAYDATQHLINCRERLQSDPRGTIHRFADLLEVSPERVGLWMFARAAAEPRESWNDESLQLARRLRAG
jgi:streptomycin 6-kinase